MNVKGKKTKGSEGKVETIIIIIMIIIIIIIVIIIIVFKWSVCF